MSWRLQSCWGLSVLTFALHTDWVLCRPQKKGKKRSKNIYDTNSYLFQVEFHLIFLRKFKLHSKFTLENMNNDKPTIEHIEYASVQQPQGLDVIDTSGSSNHRSVTGPPARSATKDDTQTGTRGFIDDTKNDLKKEKSSPRVTTGEKSTQTASSTSSKQPKLHERTQKCFPSLFKSCEDRWVFEITCCLFALCNLLAIITILAVHQEKSLPHWPYVISVNSLVSIFTALMKAAMMLVVSAGIWQCEPTVS